MRIYNQRQSAYSFVQVARHNNKKKTFTRRLLERIFHRRVLVYPLFICALCYVAIIMRNGPHNNISRKYALVQKKVIELQPDQSSFSDLLKRLSKYISLTAGNASWPDCPKPAQYPVEFPWWTDDRSARPPINFTVTLTETLKITESATKDLPPGGHWRPPHCKPANNIAILVPYRNRPEQLQKFVDYMHPFLQRQNLAYTIYIVEQGNENAFNRALLFNIGFVEAKKLMGGHDCYYFHDVDLIPENENNLYNCPKLPRHHSVAIDIYDYNLLYKGNFGGVTSMKTEHFELINGFSNLFYGWGGEDDDFFNRAKRHVEIMRYPKSVASYGMLSHKKEEGNPVRNSFLGRSGKIHKSDGLNSLCYRVLSIDLLPRYTRIVADFNQTYQFNENMNSSMKCNNGEKNYDTFQQTLDKINE